MCLCCPKCCDVLKTCCQVQFINEMFYHLIAAWREGDCCLAPDPKDGPLREGTIRRLTSTSHDEDAVAWVVFADRGKDEEEEQAIPVSRLTRPGLSHFAQEKPVFPGSVTDSGLRVPLELSDVDGDEVPYTINRYLRDYQREGIRFLYNNYIRSRGCILGDDMGLGKTVQVPSTFVAKLFSDLCKYMRFFFTWLSLSLSFSPRL